MAAKCRMKKTSFKQGMMTNNISCKQLAVLRLEGRDAKGATTIEANPAPPQPANCHANSHRPPLRNPAILFWCLGLSLWGGAVWCPLSTNMLRTCEDYSMGLSALCNSFGDFCACKAKQVILLMHLMLWGMNWKPNGSWRSKTNQPTNNLCPSMSPSHRRDRKTTKKVLR